MSLWQYRGSNNDLTNVPDHLISARPMRKSVRAVMALRKQIVNGRFSFRDRARWRGEFINPAWLARRQGALSQVYAETGGDPSVPIARS